MDNTYNREYIDPITGEVKEISVNIDATDSQVSDLKKTFNINVDGQITAVAQKELDYRIRQAKLDSIKAYAIENKHQHVLKDYITSDSYISIIHGTESFLNSCQEPVMYINIAIGIILNDAPVDVFEPNTEQQIGGLIQKSGTLHLKNMDVAVFVNNILQMSDREILIYDIANPKHSLYLNNMDDNKKTGVELISDERLRQIEVEGYDAEHDERETWDVFASAAISYIVAGLNPEMAMDFWPWDEEYYKPKDTLRNLERAGALIAASIDRYKSELQKEKLVDSLS